jgi:organic radical activating enzyme
MTQRLPVHEQFYSFQGEGCHAGRAAYFIRLFGCPVHCPWCDSAGTWHPDFTPKHIERVEVATLAAAAAASAAEFTVITGGEPTIHDLRGLTDALQAVGQPVHLETSGAFPIKGDFDWITLSPKRWKLPLEANLALADELKIIVDRVDAIAEYKSTCPTTQIPSLAAPRVVAAPESRNSQCSHPLG